MEWQKLTTECGAPLYVLEMPHAQSVASGVLVRVGTRDEKWPEEAGMAHALEHMLFHGAGQFPDSKAVSGEVENTGGWLNAWTSKEATAYHNVVPQEYTIDALLVLKEQIYNPRFLADKIPTEMSTILEEVKMYEDNPIFRVFIRHDKILYGEHDLGKDPLGLAEAIRSFKQDDFFNFHRRFYHPRNLALVVVGRVGAEGILDYINSHFYSLLNLPFRIKTERSLAPAEILSFPDVVERREIDQANIRLGWIIPPAVSKDAKALKVFRDMIGTGMSSPLFQEVREKRGLCYRIGADVECCTDAGDFSIYIGTDTKRIHEAVEAIHDVVEENKNNEQLLDLVKKMTSGKIMLASEKTADILGRALESLSHGEDPLSLDQTLEEVNGTTINDITSAVNKYLVREETVTAMVLPQS